jgi:uncharacterized SAM-binding protein YcdF (DUF218 family)
MPTDLVLFLSKFAPLVALPEGLVALSLLAIAVCALLRAHRVTTILSAAAFGLFWACAMPTVANWLTATLEGQNPSDPLTLSQAEVAIVLGGAVSAPIPPRDAPELSAAADRVWYAAHLLRSHRVRRIMVVGGNVPWGRQAPPEAEVIRDLLLDLGVPRSRIQIGTMSRNTYENAIEAKTLSREQPFATALLVTSAAHMPRAFAVFKKAEIPVVPAPCDFRSSDVLTETILDWLPHADAFAMTSAAVREWIGYYAYHWRGWL